MRTDSNFKRRIKGRSERVLTQALTQVNQWPDALRWALLVSTLTVCGLLLAATIMAPLDLLRQSIFAFILFTAALLIRKFDGRLPIVALIVLSLIASLRYMYWRLTETLDLENLHDLFFGYGLVLAELYAMLVMIFGYVQTAWPLQRRPLLLTGDPAQWPTVDVFITTFNESLSIVSLTVFAAQAMDWPKEKLNIYVLDDGRRPEFKDFCESIGVHYLTRDNNLHAKAGNFNAALKVTHGQFIAAFDADHVPTRSFLQIGMGWFLKDPKLAMMQTPHYFFSPDPFEKNLDTYRTVPNEGELFYGVVQDGNDLWNAALFCGSCAILRRGPLEEVGGVAIETVTEDAHTALKLNRAGYNTAYLTLPQAAGLATESLSRHISQRVRWARGMTQIFRTNNPMLGKGLTLAQRICYSNAMLHFFSSIPRLVFLTAPLAYLAFGAQIFHAAPLMVVAYAAPHLLLSNLTSSRIQGRFRYSYWNEVYETVLAWHIIVPVFRALVTPTSGKFNVTDKGAMLHEGFFDWEMARPYITLLLINVAGLFFGIYDYIGADETTDVTVLLNQIWALYNIVITSAAVAVASETRQIRTEPRVHAELPASVQLADGTQIAGMTQDFSQRGLGLKLSTDSPIPLNEQLHVTLMRNEQPYVFPCKVVFSKGQNIGVQFSALTLHQQSDLVRLTFSRADTWAASWGSSKPASSLAALRDVALIGLHGITGLVKISAKQIRTSPLFSRLRTSHDPDILPS
ncbi:MAG: UDP-forming cellulose synthase catalytic subunit [Pseudomonas sp.]